MGRRKADGTKVKKRKKVTVQLLKRMHAGEVTQPYQILEDLLETVHGELQDAKFAIAWRLGWRADANGLLRLGQCRKRSDLDRELDAFDFVILLNKEAWPTLNDKQKLALIDHEMCHAQIVMDTDGEAKYDDRNRLVCRIRKHDVEEFQQIVDRHGCYTQELSKIAQAGINDAKRPLLTTADGREGDKPDDPDAWRKTKLSAIGFKANHLDSLERAGLKTLGDLQDKMNHHGQFWCKELKINGRFKETIEDCFNAWISKETSYQASVAEHKAKMAGK